MEREHLGSRLGFILLSAGCAIGVGNVWKFPYLAGQSGGGLFVLVYLFFLVILGLPVLTMEFSMGRAAQKSPVRLYQQLEPQGSKWHLHGYVAMAGNYILMMFYTTVCGWMIYYFFATAGGAFVGADTARVGAIFSEMLANTPAMVGCMLLTVIGGFAVCSIGLQNGLERVTKWMMLALLAIMLILAVNSVTMEGGSEGLAFYLVPDLERAMDVGILTVLVNAMNQSFFTLSLGIGAMAIFGSYLNKDRALLGESVNVTVLDTFVAFTSGLIIFPACFAYGVEPDSGPNLIFVTLPNIFNHMPLGRLWGSLFFLFLLFASFSTVLAVFENIMACCSDLFGWSRKKSGLINTFIMIVLSLPCTLGFNVLSGIQPFGEGSSIMDLEDFVVSNLLLPIGSLIFVLFCVTRYGWGWKNFLHEANQGKGLKFPDHPALRFYITFILPLIVIAILAVGVLDKFGIHL